MAAKKNWRLLELPGCADPYPKGTLDLKRVAGGLLVQELDRELYHQPELKVVTKRAPTEEEMQDLRLAMQVVKHVKSNGIVLVKNGQSVGIGPGQTNRITALELAIKYAGERSQGAVMGSDAFFPFDDCVRAAHAAGVTAIIQPGGSLRDSDSIKFCDEVGMAMVFTGMRHFKHNCPTGHKPSLQEGSMNKLDILVVGGGGREHAIIKKLAESPRCGRLYACPGNGGMADLAECLPHRPPT